MRLKISITILLVPLFFIGNAQNNSSDSIISVINKNQNFDTKFNIIYDHLYKSFTISFDEKIEFCKKVLNSHPDALLESLVRNELGYILYNQGFKKDGINYIFRANEIARIKGNNRLQGITYYSLGVCSEDSVKTINYLQQAYEFSLSANDFFNVGIALNEIARFYFMNQNYDSSLKYANLATSSFQNSGYNYKLGRPNALLSNIYLKYFKDTLIAKGFARKALNEPQVKNYPEEYCAASLNYAYIAYTNGNPDTCIFYLNQLSKNTKWMNLDNVISMFTLYRNVYMCVNCDSTLKYYRLLDSAQNLKIKINKSNQASILLVKNELNLENEKEYRKQNIQYLLLLIGIITLVSIFLIYTRSIVANSAAIKYLGIISLLFVFEFFFLVLHPILENITHHNPILMLLALVAIAAILIPLHFKIEHWAIQKLIKINEKIRLAAAKKTIEQLEKNSSSQDITENT